MKSVFFAAVFISSFLLFLVQPMLAKAMLPMVGGSPAVWVVCMLFFQLLLLAGYAYAALGSAYLQARTQMMVHVGLLAFMLLISYPIALSSQFDPAAYMPEIWVLLTLLFTIGFPYFLLSAHSSLFQRWYFQSSGASPYFLFMASNVGSLLGLFAYPLVIEWLLPISSQMQFFGVGYVVFFLLLMMLSWNIRGKMLQQKLMGLGANLPWHKAGLVALLGFIPSSLMLSSTLFVATDVASFPLMWIIPLALYLVSFIVVFSRYGDRWVTWAQKCHVVAIGVIVAIGILTTSPWFAVGHFIGFFVIAVSCHGRVAANKPAAENLAAYYFWLALGGALGGLFNTLAPYIFNDVLEYFLVCIASLLILPTNAKLKIQKWDKKHLQKVVLPIAGLLSAMWYVWFYEPVANNTAKKDNAVMYQERNFFGVSKVRRDEKTTKYSHGTTLHGMQPRAPEESLLPTSYYGVIADVLARFPESFFKQPFGVIGLGAGTQSCLGHKGQSLDFYEIDQAVIDIATNPAYFTYVKNCPPNISIIKGDARLQLEKQTDKHYQLLVVDAFSSDAIPMHLITQQAMALYQKRLVADTGIIAINISNRYLDLKPVVAKMAATNGLLAYHRFDAEADAKKYRTAASWIILLQKNSPWQRLIENAGFRVVEPSVHTPLWTDDYSNILQSIIWGTSSLDKDNKK